MHRRCINITAIAICLFILCLLGGCSSKSNKIGSAIPSQDIAPAKETDLPSSNGTEVIKPDNSIQGLDDKEEDKQQLAQLKLDDTSYESIDRFLEGNKNAKYTWSNNKQYAAISYGNETSSHMYIWEVGKNEPIEAKGFINDWNFTIFYWSPDDSYVVCDFGTSPSRVGDICWAKGAGKVGPVSYVGKPIWSPDSKWLALGNHKSVDTDADTSLEGTTDIVIYNVETKERRVIVDGNNEFYMMPDRWESDGTLAYTKYYFAVLGKKETVSVKLSAEKSPAITYDDQKEVEQLIKSYVGALEKKDYEASLEFLAYDRKIYSTQFVKFEYLWPFDSIKLISLESYLPPELAFRGDAAKDAPTVCFLLKIDAKPKDQLIKVNNYFKIY